jgi:hypothetical protein
VPEPSDYWTEFEQRLTELGAQPVLIGALAALEYRADPRMTIDVDFLVRSLDGVAAAFRADGYDVREVSEFEGQPYVIFIRGRGARVDALLVETAYQDEAHRRAVNGTLTVEDVIVHKLIAWRAKDQDDIESIMSTRPELDLAYIARWAAEWQVDNRWVEARSRWANPEQR